MRRAGRGLGPWSLAVPLLASGLWILHRLEHPPDRDTVAIGRRVDVVPPEHPADDAVVDGWRGSASLAGAELELELAPLIADPVTREFQEARLRAHLGLSPGRGWRLTLRAGGAGLGWQQLFVEAADRERTRLVPLLETAAPPDGEPADPLRALYAAPTSVAPARAVTVFLWGPEPPAEQELVLHLVRARGEETVVLEPVELTAGALAGPLIRLRPPEPRTSSADGSAEAAGADDRATEGETVDLTAEVERLRAELEAERSRRRERELEWWEYNRALAKLDLDGLLRPFPQDPGEVALEADHPASPAREGEEAEAAEPRDPARERAEEIARSMRALLRVEGVRGFEPLELGRVSDGGTGPVVMRLLDDRGRLAGSLYAERLRLEASRAAHTLTFVLERGYESHLGRREPFADGVRRLPLSHIDPEPWIESMPELFRGRDRRPPADDGRWPLAEVRRELNDLLALDIANGWYRVSGFEGVSGDALVDVHLDSFDASGRLERRYFADRLRIDVQEDGVLLLLEGGAMVRGDEQKSFLGGTHRLYLPNAPVEAWRAARLPGIAPPPGDATGEATGEAGSRED